MGLHPATDPTAVPDPLARLAGFGPGIQLATPEGEMPIEWLATGDRLITRDGPPAPVLWLARRRFSRAHLARAAELRPVEIAPGGLGPDAPGPGAPGPGAPGLSAPGLGAPGLGAPTHATRLAPATRVLLTGWEVELFAGEEAGLAEISRLDDSADIAVPPTTEGTHYSYVVLPAHALVRANGLWVETLRLDGTARDVFAAELPPALLARPEVVAGHARTAHPCLTGWEIAAIRDRKHPSVVPGPIRHVA